MNIDMIQEREKEDIEYLVKHLVDALKKEPQAILLCGGYGRNEGAWIADENGMPMPYNDYDFAVISDVFFSAEEYSIFRKQMANDIGITWIDIDFYHLDELSNLKCTIKNVDLAYASKLVYGDPKVYERIPKHDLKNIGKSDIVKLYQTRIWTFLGSWNDGFKNLDVEDARFFKNQMAKAVLAACDMYLIVNKMYTPSYCRRVELICSTCSMNKELCEMAQWAVKEKTRPSSEPMTCEEMKELYFKAKAIFCDAISIGMGKYGKFFIQPQKTKKYFVFFTDYLLRDMYNKIFRKNRIISKALDIFLAQNYVFMAINESTIDEKYLNEANKLLIKWGYLDKPIENWEKLHVLVANARNNL